jgi:hypothetical protein
MHFDKFLNNEKTLHENIQELAIIKDYDISFVNRCSKENSMEKEVWTDITNWQNLINLNCQKREMPSHGSQFHMNKHVEQHMRTTPSFTIMQFYHLNLKKLATSLSQVFQAC